MVKNVITTLSMLAFSDDATTRVLGLFVMHLFAVNDQNKFYTFKDLIFVFLKMISFVSLSRCIIL